MNLSPFYKKVRQNTIAICSPLKIEDYLLQTAFFISPAKWSLGHTSWFFEELILKQFDKNYKEYHPRYNFLFNSYYNTIGERIVRHSRGDLNRPTVEEVYMYRDYVDQHMLNLLEKQNLKQDVANLIELGLNHEQQHQELLLTDLKFAFAANPLFPEYSDVALTEESENEDLDFLEVNGGIYDIGFREEGFCYDNELSPHKVLLGPYSIRKTLATNGEFMEFIEDDGYGRFEFWHDDALAWLKEKNIRQPMYWHKQGKNWHQATLAGLRKINPRDILAHITYYEAAAFAQWKGCRLPTEFEWEAAADFIDWGKRWEYTESAYLPYPGYKKAAGAEGEYNGKFMVNQMVLRGASVATPQGHSRKTYRNFFHPEMGWQFNGIRLAK